MPELPEVETVKETLKRQILGKKIKKVTIYYSGIIAAPSIEEFQKNIKNQTINDIKRRGKWLMFDLDAYYLLSHLRMEGKYYIKKSTDLLTKHQHVVFDLDDCELRYNDTRKFGKMYLLDKKNAYNEKPLNELGLEPWDDNLTSNYLINKFKNKKLPIKTLLLDQSIIVGLGNIYVDEVLFLSKINPFKKGYELNSKELDAIIKNTKTILEKAIELGGTTIRTYTSSEGVHGKFQNELLVHTKEICPVCKERIIKTRIGSRGTYYCPNCQK